MSRAVSIAELATPSVFTADGVNDRVGIGTTQPTAKLDVGGDAHIAGNISVAGTITYDDVTNVDSIGVITARNGIKVLSNGIDVTGVITATSFSGSGANLTDVISGVELKQSGSPVGSAITAINFDGATVSTPSSGLSTVTIASQLTIGVRTGAAVTFNLTGSSFNVINRSGGNVTINI